MYSILIFTLHLPLANLAVIETNKELIWFQLQNINYSGVLNTCYVFLLSASESQHLFLGSYDLKMLMFLLTQRTHTEMRFKM